MSSPLAAAGAQLNNIFRLNGHVFYGWWIVLAFAGVQWLAALTWMHSYGGYALKLQADLGWRSMAPHSSILIFMVGLPLVGLARHRPENYGEVPDEVRPQKADDEDTAPQETQLSLSSREAERESSFCLISSRHAPSLLTVSSMLAYLISLRTFDLGYAPVNAGFAFALMSALQMAGLFLGGVIGDRFDKRAL